VWLAYKLNQIFRASFQITSLAKILQKQIRHILQNELLLNLKGSHLYLERANRRIDITSYIQSIKFNFILETNAAVKISKQSKPYIFAVLSL